MVKLAPRRPVRKRDNAISMDILEGENPNQVIQEETKETAPVIMTEPKLFDPKEIIDFKVCHDEDLNSYLNLKGTELIKMDINSALEKGKVLTEVFENLAGNNQYDGLYYNWLSKMEYNPRTALRQRIRYELFCCGHDDRSKEFFASLPVVLIDKINTHKEKELLISMVNSGEFKTHSDITTYIDSGKVDPRDKIKPTVSFYKQVFNYEKKLKKMGEEDRHKALEELAAVEKEIKRLKKLYKEEGN